MVTVKRHIKIHGTPSEKRKIRAGLSLMKLYGWDRNLPNVCIIKTLDAVSHTAGPFIADKDTCVEINIEPDDLKDDVETGLAIAHESMHARDILERGIEAVDEPEDELQVHKETGQLVKEALKKEDRPSYMGRLAEELSEQESYIEHYERESFKKSSRDD